MTGSATLPMRTAVLLLHAWLGALTERHGYRALFIKGPGLAFHGLRDDHSSTDVDVLVDPERFDDFCSTLQSNRWTERRITFAGAQYTQHSRTFVHPGWPCDIDVHRFFPGFVAPESEVFDALWARRVPMPAADRPCAIPDRPSSMLILGLHAVRSRADNTRHARELEYMLDHADLDSSGRADLSVLAARTGAGHTLAEILGVLGVSPATAGSSPTRVHVRALAEWNLRVASGASTGYLWTSLVRRQQGWQRVRTICRAVWPSRLDLLRMRPETRDTPLERLRARASRVVTGSPGVWRAVRVVAAERRRSRR